MMRLSKLAGRAAVPVFVAAGIEGGALMARLLRAHQLRLVDTPRQATVLLVAGTVPDHLATALQRVHDQMPHPRITLWWKSDSDFSFSDGRNTDPQRLSSSAADQLAATIQELHRDLLSGAIASEPDLGEDQPPCEWQGKGDHGQGGEGMMGGVPYGRPMAMTDEDCRDGLALDALQFTAGPFLPGWPPGLQAQIVLQGDLIQEWTNCAMPIPVSLPSVFYQALEEEVGLGELETARAALMLRLLAGMLTVDGPRALADRTLLLAAELEESGGRPDRHSRGFARLMRHLRVATYLHFGRGLGVLGRQTRQQFGGWVARAGGTAEDYRKEIAVYQENGFECISYGGDDVRSRLRQLVAETRQSLYLASVAGDCRLPVCEKLETPLGKLPATASPGADVLERLVPGLEWSEAIRVIASLPLQPLAEHTGKRAQ